MLTYCLLCVVCSHDRVSGWAVLQAGVHLSEATITHLGHGERKRGWVHDQQRHTSLHQKTGQWSICWSLAWLVALDCVFNLMEVQQMWRWLFKFYLLLIFHVSGQLLWVNTVTVNYYCMVGTINCVLLRPIRKAKNCITVYRHVFVVIDYYGLVWNWLL